MHGQLSFTAPVTSSILAARERMMNTCACVDHEQPDACVCPGLEFHAIGLPCYLLHGWLKVELAVRLAFDPLTVKKKNRSRLMYMWEYLESLRSRAWSRMSLLSLSHGHSLEISQHRSLSCMPLRESSAPNEILGDVAKLCHCISNWRSMEMPDRQWCPMFPVFLQFQQLFPQCLSIVFGRCLPLQRTSSGCFPCSWKKHWWMAYHFRLSAPLQTMPVSPHC